MNFVVDVAALAKGLQAVKGALRSSPIPVYTHILFAADGDSLRLTASDGEQQICATVPADVVRGGAAAVSGRLVEIVGKLPAGAQVEMAVEKDERLTLTAGRSRFQIPTLPAKDFPVMAGRGDGVVEFDIAANVLADLLKHVRFAESTEQTRYYLNGTFLHVWRAGPDQLALLRAVATDGHRLARLERVCPPAGAGMAGVILPRQATAPLLQLLQRHGDATAEMSVSEKLVTVAMGEVTLTSTLVDGTFPEYERVIPFGEGKVAAFSPKEMADAVERVAIMAGEKSRIIRLDFRRAGLTLSCSGSETGTATEEVDIEYGDAPLTVGVNSRYMLDILALCQGDTARIELYDPASPMKITGSGTLGGLYVLMPARV